jgi:hypothetical protein
MCRGADMFFSNKNIPPCPDLDKYVLVVTREGSFWRRKRGSVRRAVLNEKLKGVADAMKLCSPAAKRITAKLRLFTNRFETGRLHSRIYGRLIKQFNKDGVAGLSCLKDMELQPRFPLEGLLKGEYTITVKDGLLKLHVPIRDYTVNRNSQLVSGYLFELVLIYGDCMEENSLRVEAETSEVFGIDENVGECEMRIVLPEKEWMVLLKVSCVEGREMAKGARGYGMRVVLGGKR